MRFSERKVRVVGNRLAGDENPSRMIVSEIGRGTWGRKPRDLAASEHQTGDAALITSVNLAVHLACAIG